MIKAFIAWLHRITAPPVEVEVKVGDVWVGVDNSPWSKGCVILDVAEGWVRFRNSRDEVHDMERAGFLKGMKLKSRAQ